MAPGQSVIGSVPLCPWGCVTSSIEAPCSHRVAGASLSKPPILVFLNLANWSASRELPMGEPAWGGRATRTPPTAKWVLCPPTRAPPCHPGAGRKPLRPHRVARARAAQRSQSPVRPVTRRVLRSPRPLRAPGSRWALRASSLSVGWVRAPREPRLLSEPGVGARRRRWPCSGALPATWAPRAVCPALPSAEPSSRQRDLWPPPRK